MNYPVIYHIVSGEAWQAAMVSGAYRPPSLASDGFIHLSTIHQVESVANRFYRGQAGLVLLHVAVDKLTAELRYEPPAHPDGSKPAELEREERFPHLYGPLNPDAVIAVQPLTPGSDGLFSVRSI